MDRKTDKWHIARVIFIMQHCSFYKLAAIKFNYSLVGWWLVPFVSLFLIPEAIFFSSSFHAFGFVDLLDWVPHGIIIDEAPLFKWLLIHRTFSYWPKNTMGRLASSRNLLYPLWNILKQERSFKYSSWLKRKVLQ